VNNRCTRTLSIFLGAFLLISSPLPAADDVRLLRGQLTGGPAATFTGLFVSLEDITGRHEIHRIDIRFDGAFEFRDLPTGDYVLRVTDFHGETIAQQFVSVQQGMTEVAVRLRDAGAAPMAPGTISIRQLSHPPDRKAMQAFTAALRLSSSGKYDAAAAELQKAIRISPEFAGAYTNLAVYHMRLGRFEEAADETARALEIGGPDPINLCNLAFAQFHLGRVKDALASAGAALRLDSGYLQAHLILGTILSADPASRDEAIRHLELAAGKFESARTNLELLRRAR
jgi:tetratricopeptide repeat protein